MKGVRKMVRVQMIIKLLPFNFIEVTFTVFNSNEITAGQSMFGRINFGTEFHWNVNFGIMQKDYVCRS